MRALVLLSILTALPASVAAAPPNVEPGQQYAGGTTVRFAQIGLDLTIPKKWIGAVAPGGEAFVLVSQSEPGMILATAEPGTSVAKVKASMTETVPLDDVTLTPAGPPKVKGDRLEQRYTTNNAQIVGLAVAVVKDELGVGFVAVGPKTATKQYRALLAGLVKSLRFLPRPKPGDTGGGTWHAKLAGFALEHLKTSNGLSTSHTIHLCKDGSFSSSGGDSYLSGGFSAVGSNGSAGTWRIEGATLTLNHRSGGATTHRLTSEGNKTFLNGTRYFVANPASCR